VHLFAVFHWHEACSVEHDDRDGETMMHSTSSLCLLCLLVPALAGAAEDLPGGAEVPIYERGTVTFYVDGGIDGYGDTAFMLDTGSAYVTIDQSTLAVLERHSRAEFLRTIEGMMADGRRRSVPIYRLSGIRLGQCEIRDVEAAVFPRGTRHILGLNALKAAAPFTVSLEPPRLALGKCATG
jgi:predicted aspartyl protease